MQLESFFFFLFFFDYDLTVVVWASLVQERLKENNQTGNSSSSTKQVLVCVQMDTNVYNLLEL